MIGLHDNFFAVFRLCSWDIEKQMYVLRPVKNHFLLDYTFNLKYCLLKTPFYHSSKTEDWT